MLALQNNLNISTELDPQNRRSELFSTELFKFTPVTCTEVQRIITTMPSNKSPGPDKISMRIIKDCLPVILGPLTDIINNSFTTSAFPESWKIAEIIPLLKEGDHEVAANNRPLSMLKVLSKICEKVALNQFSGFLNRTDRLSSQQKYHSTETLRPRLHYTGLLSEWVKFCRYRKAVKIFNLRDPNKHANSVKLISICY
jgi:hypothetical protein